MEVALVGFKPTTTAFVHTTAATSKGHSKVPNNRPGLNNRFGLKNHHGLNNHS